MFDSLAQAARATGSAELSAHLNFLAAAATDMVQALMLTQHLDPEEAERVASRHPLIARGLEIARQVEAAEEADDEHRGRRAS